MKPKTPASGERTFGSGAKPEQILPLNEVISGARSTVVDIFSRFSSAIDPRFSYRGDDVVETLERVCAKTGYPNPIRVDQGRNLSSAIWALWADAKGVTLDLSRPGKPTDNVFIEAFNGKLPAECPNAHWFINLADGREKLEHFHGVPEHIRSDNGPEVTAKIVDLVANDDSQTLYIGKSVGERLLRKLQWQGALRASE